MQLHSIHHYPLLQVSNVFTESFSIFLSAFSRLLNVATITTSSLWCNSFASHLSVVTLPWLRRFSRRRTVSQAISSNRSIPYSITSSLSYYYCIWSNNCNPQVRRRVAKKQILKLLCYCANCYQNGTYEYIAFPLKKETLSLLTSSVLSFLFANTNCIWILKNLK